MAYGFTAQAAALVAFVMLLSSCKRKGEESGAKKFDSQVEFEGIESLEGKNAIARAVRMRLANFIETNVSQIDGLVAQLNSSPAGKKEEEFVIDNAILKLEKSSNDDDKDSAKSLKEGIPAVRVANPLFSLIAKEFQKLKIKGIVSGLILMDPELSKTDELRRTFLVR